jgi:hypothetical protein
MVPIGTTTDAIGPKRRGETDADGGVDDTAIGPSRGAQDARDECIAQTVEELSLAFAKTDCDAVPEPSFELSPKLKLRVTPASSTVSSGGRVELRVVITNDGAEKTPIFFRLDPKPRFEIEASDSRGKRVDIPTGKGKRPPQSETAKRIGRITLLPG